MQEQHAQTPAGKKLLQPHWLGIMAAVGLLLLSVLGLLFVQKPLQETQEVRPEAAVATGTVLITTNSNSNFTVGQPAKIQLSVDTKSAPTTGVQLVFNIHSTAGFQDMTAEVLTSSGLQSAYLELEQTADGALVGLIALPPAAQQFTTNSPIPFFEINFVPTSAGTMNFNFDTERSIVTRYANNPPEDILQSIASSTYTIRSTNPSPSPTTTPAVTPSPSPTTSPNTSCNKACTGNSSCPINYRCYSVGNESRCRLVTNPTSTTCQSAPDAGLNRRCNEYCADSRECAVGFSCWQNRCRNPENIDNTSCAALTQTQQRQAKASCNQSCTTNSNCATNLRCYSGRCRLASNPSSLSCSSTTASTVSDSYNTPSKGADDGSATDSGTIKASPTATPLTGLPPDTANDTDTAEVADDNAQATLLSMIATAEYSLPLKVLLAGFIVLVIALIVGGLLSRRRNRPFAEVANQASAPAPIPAVSPTQQPPATQQPLPQVPSAPRMPSAPIPYTQTPPPTPAPTPVPQTTSANSMLTRMREKGISPPSHTHSNTPR